MHQSLKGYFGLRGFHGKTFVVNAKQSYGDQIVVDVIMANGRRFNFSRGTEAELLREIDPAPVMIKDGKHFKFEAEYILDLAKKSADQVKYIMADAQAAADAMPDGKNAMFYMQEVRLCSEFLNDARW